MRGFTSKHEERVFQISLFILVRTFMFLLICLAHAPLVPPITIVLKDVRLLHHVLHKKHGIVLLKSV